MLFYAVVFWWFDRYEKEPLPLLIAAFIWGAVPSIILAVDNAVDFGHYPSRRSVPTP
jgi:RsiW-degrading membrane proteinase PrsW (M82 family)